MASTSVTLDTLQQTIEARDIHLAACRYRSQGHVCSTCTEVVDRAERAIRASAPIEQAA